MSTNIYVLQLTHGKYYVGKSEDVMRRYGEHLAGEGALWTQKYKPVKMCQVILSADEFDEDKITKKYMAKYGSDNVRGGSYTAINLNNDQKSLLEREICTAEDRCTTCGKNGHFASQCVASTPKSTQRSAPVSHSAPQYGQCFRCGRTSHYAYNCYAMTDKYGDYLSDSDDDSYYSD